jgi:hypothetical protein
MNRSRATDARQGAEEGDVGGPPRANGLPAPQTSHSKIGAYHKPTMQLFFKQIASMAAIISFPLLRAPRLRLLSGRNPRAGGWV